MNARFVFKYLNYTTVSVVRGMTPCLHFNWASQSDSTLRAMRKWRNLDSILVESFWEVYIAKFQGKKEKRSKRIQLRFCSKNYFLLEKIAFMVHVRLRYNLERPSEATVWYLSVNRDVALQIYYSPNDF